MLGSLLKGLGKVFTKQTAKVAISKFAKQTSKAAVKAVTTAAKNPKTWKKIGATVGGVALTYGTEKLLAKKDLTPRKKLKELKKMFELGEISEEEYKMVRKKILDTY